MPSQSSAREPPKAGEKWNSKMNPYQRLSQRSTLWIRRVFYVYIGVYGIHWAFTPTAHDHVVVSTILNLMFWALFAALIVIEVSKQVSYYRCYGWTGKYPFYFLFPKSRDRVAQREQQAERQRLQKEHSPVA